MLLVSKDTPLQVWKYDRYLKDGITKRKDPSLSKIHRITGLGHRSEKLNLGFE